MVTTTASPVSTSAVGSKTLPPPTTPSPWIQTITGLSSPERGVVTFRTRQSSLVLDRSA
jgi:hypothetical protein